MEHIDLLELISYNADNGEFSWKKRRRGVRTGIALGTDNGFGYKRITVSGNSYYAHRLAWFFCHGEWPKGEIDHINGDKSDNRIANLRDISRQGNAQNKTKSQSNNKNKTLGVSWHKGAGKWQAHICIYKKRKYLGLFDDVKEAENAYLNEKRKVVIV